MHFKLKAEDSSSGARAGTLLTDHGSITTPIFMPVGTLASVKAVSQKDLAERIGAQIILGNTYHLYLRPGLDLFENAGGLHQFMGWDKPILTDSGGYQVYSLGHKRIIDEEGVTFSSHIDGSKHNFTPENVIEAQRKIGSDIMMAFDECPPYQATYEYTRKSMQLTHRWLKRCISTFDSTEPIYGYQQILAPIVQGGTFKELRKESAQVVTEYSSPVLAIGGLSVGEPKEIMYEMTHHTVEFLPKTSARYLMGVGTPENILECISAGIDMFDCVLPTRNARHGLLYTSKGTINIKNKKWENDFSPIDPSLENDISNYYSKAYLRHLILSKEILGAQIATIQNLSFFLNLITIAREQIIADNFIPWKRAQLDAITKRL